MARVYVDSLNTTENSAYLIINLKVGYTDHDSL